MNVFQLNGYSTTSTLFEDVAFEVELLRDAEVREVLRDVARPVEQHAVPFLQRLARQVEARVVREFGGADVLAAAVVAPAVQRAGDGAAGKRARALQHDRLAMAADVRDEVVRPSLLTSDHAPFARQSSTRYSPGFGAICSWPT
jgi:hypothetical protein